MNDLFRKMNAYFRAANYLSVGQIYLLANPLLKAPLELAQVKPRLLGHWGTTPGLNFLYVHMNRVIKERDLDAIFVTGPGHGGPALVANAYLEGTYSEVYPEGRRRTPTGCDALFKQFSSPRRRSQPRLARDAREASHEGGELRATRCPTPSELHSTTPTCSSSASSATARRRPVRSRRAGTPTNS